MATLRMEHKMRYINELSEGQQVKEIYLCKKIIPAQTKAGKT
jgi:3'-5' exoribonuclease